MRTGRETLFQVPWQSHLSEIATTTRILTVSCIRTIVVDSQSRDCEDRWPEFEPHGLLTFESLRAARRIFESALIKSRFEKVSFWFGHGVS